MSAFYLNPPSPFPQVEGSQGQDHLLFTFASQSSIYFKATQELGDYDEDHQEPPPRLHKHEADVRFSAGGSVDQNQLPSSLPAVADQNYNNSYGQRYSSTCKRDDLRSNPCDNGVPINSPTKWMSSKMRIMRKMMNSDQTVTNKLKKDAQTSPNDQNNSTNAAIRVCSDCNTTKTPLWRSGPKGPKSLCNACGIRQRKARRALAAASGGVVPPLTNDEVPKEKRSDSNCTIQYKKRCKPGGPRTKKKIQFDNFIVSSSENSSFHRMFPQDERDAAILLMALSCGLVYS